MSDAFEWVGLVMVGAVALLLLVVVGCAIVQLIRVALRRGEA